MSRFDTWVALLLCDPFLRPGAVSHGHRCVEEHALTIWTGIAWGFCVTILESGWNVGRNGVLLLPLADGGFIVVSSEEEPYPEFESGWDCRGSAPRIVFRCDSPAEQRGSANVWA